MLLRTLIVIAAPMSLMACTTSLDDPMGIKQRRAKARAAECQRIYDIMQSSDGQRITTQTAPDDYLKNSEIYLNTAQTLEDLDLRNKNLQLLTSYLAAGYRHDATNARDMAAVENPYDGASYVLETYCRGEDISSVLESFPGDNQWER